jgi:hypothetical protein
VNDAGVTLADAYTAGGEVLMGTLRWEKERAESVGRKEVETMAKHKQVILDSQSQRVVPRIPLFWSYLPNLLGHSPTRRDFCGRSFSGLVRGEPICNAARRLSEFQLAGILEARLFWETLYFWSALLWRGESHCSFRGILALVISPALKRWFSFVSRIAAGGPRDSFTAYQKG